MQNFMKILLNDYGRTDGRHIRLRSTFFLFCIEGLKIRENLKLITMEDNLGPEFDLCNVWSVLNGVHHRRYVVTFQY